MRSRRSYWSRSNARKERVLSQVRVCFVAPGVLIRRQCARRATRNPVIARKRLQIARPRARTRTTRVTTSRPCVHKSGALGYVTSRSSRGVT